MAGAKTVWGSMYVGTRPAARIKDEAVVQEMFDILQRHGVAELDTAQSYATSEEFLGRMGAGSIFSIGTKTGGRHVPESMRNDELVKRAHESLRKLKVEKVDIFYIHSPDTDVPMSDYLSSINATYEAGVFSRFGLSNFNAAQVVAVHAHCRAHGYVLPTVFQGNFNAVARHLEFQLLPTLRRLGIAFYAYSPLAGGFLSRTKRDIVAGHGRFGQTAGSTIYAKMYARPTLLDALDRWGEIAEEAGCSRAELAYRWVKFNSVLRVEKGDALLISGSTPQQLEETLKGLESGPLSDEVAAKIDALWASVEAEAPLDNYHI